MALAFRQIPGWISWENQGANIASADLDHDGAPELIILRIDRPRPGPNRGFYRVGNRLDVRAMSLAAGVRGSRFRTGDRTKTKAQGSPSAILAPTGSAWSFSRFSM